MKCDYFGNAKSGTVLIQPVDDHDLELMDQEIRHIRDLTGGEDFLLVAAEVERWNRDLTPWPAPAVFGEEAFGSGAARTLQYLITDVIPAIPGAAHPEERRFFLGGYSLAGLFALWAAYQTDLFAGVAGASPSVWFPGFREYAMSNALQTQAVYLSLGDREEKTRNPVMSQVGDALREIGGYLKDGGIPCTLEWNRGNHFREPDLRMAKGFAWLMQSVGNRAAVGEGRPGKWPERM